MWCSSDERHPDRNLVYSVRTIPIRDSILEACDKRGDEWGVTVKQRLSNCIDLVAEEAIYHRSCYMRLYFGKTSNTASSSSKGAGRSVDVEMLSCFDTLCVWLEKEADCELYSLQELHSKMSEMAGDDEVYCKKTLKAKLVEKYGQHIYFSEIDGRNDVICFRNMANFILTDKWYSGKKDNIDDESQRIVAAAAKLILAEIREHEFSMETYPSNDDITSRDNDIIPPLLKTMLKGLIKSEVQQNSIGQSILRTIRPRSVIPPILFGLAVELDHVFGSRWLIDELCTLGFSISYDEVRRFKHSILQSDGSNQLSQYLQCGFTQWVADNLNEMRYNQFMKLSAAGASKFIPEKLPPTESAAKEHSFRVHLQILQWKSLMDTDLDPTDWGWKIDNAQLIPVMTTKDAGPPEILNIVRCKCKSANKQCQSNICSCRKNSLKCVSACGHCHGRNCYNSDTIDTETDDNLA